MRVASEEKGDVVRTWLTGWRRSAAGVALLALLGWSLGGCGGDEWESSRPAPAPLGELGAGYLPSVPPDPETTITPSPGSWDEVSPAPGYRVVLLHTGEDPETDVLAQAVRDWAGQHQVSLREVAAADPTRYLETIDETIAMGGDLIVAVGHDLIDPLATVTPHHLGQEFLIVGAELAEPTHNVTAADWTGAGFRGEGLGAPAEHDPSTFTPERAGRALRAGVAAVLTGNTGIVIWVA